MNRTKSIVRMFFLKAATIFMLAMVAAGAWAQDATTTTVKHGESSYDTQVKNAEVVYVEGNDLVLRLENGKIEHLVIPDSDKFTINGNEVTVHELQPGTRLTQTITTTTVPRYVTTIRTLKGKIWHVSKPNSVILTLPDGTNQRYTVPNHAKFNGKAKSVFDLKKGMTLEATIITDDEHTVMEQTKSTAGVMPPPATPQEVGTLLIYRPYERLQVPVLSASAETAEATLPETGSSLPLMGLAGAFAVAASLGVGAARRTFGRA